MSISQVHGNWCKRFQETTIPAHTSQEIKTARYLRKEIQTCIEIALSCVEADREKRPTISEVLDELNKFDTSTLNELNKMNNIANSSPISQVHTITLVILFFCCQLQKQCECTQCFSQRFTIFHLKYYIASFH